MRDLTQDYSMDIVVRDDARLEDKIEVKVLVTNVNEPPVISGDDMPPRSTRNRTGRVRPLHRPGPGGRSLHMVGIREL